MATKTKAPHSSRQTKGSSAAGNRRESAFMDESTAIDQIVDEIPGTIEDVTPDDHTSESSGPDKHTPVSSPARRATESSTFAGTDEEPTVDAAFASLSPAADEREFWGNLIRVIGPQIFPLIRKTGGKVFESSQTESSSMADEETEQREFWGAIAGALAPVVMPYAKKAAVKAGKTGLSWLSRVFESQEESGEDLDNMSTQLQNILLQEASMLTTQESTNGVARDEREFWGFVAKNIIPVFSPIAKAAADAAMSAGTKAVKGAAAKLTPQLLSILRREGISETAIERAIRVQEMENNDTMGEQREFWGAIAGAIVPALMPYAKKAAAAVVKKGGSWLKKRLESAQLESSSTLAYAQMEELFVDQALDNTFESASTTTDDQREFWGAIAKKLVPALTPLAKAAAGAAARAGSGWIRGLFESSETESSEEASYALQDLEDLLIEEAAGAQTESAGLEDSESEREFWGAIVNKLKPVLAPVAKNLASTVIKTGTSYATGAVKKLSAKAANMLRAAGISEYAIQQLEADPMAASMESDEPIVEEREFWRSIAKKIVPVAKKYAPKIGNTLVDVGGQLIKRGIGSLFESAADPTSDEAVREAFIEQMEALEVIIGQDDRVQITTTAQAPYNRICHLSIRAGDGSSFLGTGFFIGPRTILTAGHCVYDSDHGGWPQQIIVSPGRNGNSKPFGQFVSTRFSSVQGWIKNQSRDCDYGVIHLSPNDRVPSQIGCFGYGVFSDDYIEKRRLHIAGYPGDKPAGTMMFHSRQATDVTPTTIVYDIDTVGGQSGSPVYDEFRRVVAIHTNGASSGNSATRIIGPVFQNLSQWRMEGSM